MSLHKRKLIFSLLPFAIGLFFPWLILFFNKIFINHTNIHVALVEIQKEEFERSFLFPHLFYIELIPFIILSLFCYFNSRDINLIQLLCLVIAGVLGILYALVPIHLSLWYGFSGNEHQCSTAVVGLMFIPFTCFVTLMIGLIIGWGVSMLPIIRNRNS